MSKQAKKNNPAYAILLDDLQKTKRELELAYSNFENVLDPDLIDSCIYQVNAMQLRYKFLLGRVKELTGSPAGNPSQLSDFYAKNPLELSEP